MTRLCLQYLVIYNNEPSSILPPPFRTRTHPQRQLGHRKKLHKSHNYNYLLNNATLLQPKINFKLAILVVQNLPSKF